MMIFAISVRLRIHYNILFYDVLQMLKSRNLIMV